MALAVVVIVGFIIWQVASATSEFDCQVRNSNDALNSQPGDGWEARDC